MTATGLGSAVEWRVLGPVAVLAGGRELSMGRPRHRGLLGFLLLRTGTAVPVTRLIDALWESPPASATTQVQGCVSGIRRALRAAGVDGALRTDAAGYRLVVTVGELDLAVFDERSERARAALAAGRPAEAANRYRAALALWRGTPLAGAVGAHVNAAAARLAERRLDAWEDLAEAELAAGRPDVVAAELRLLCDEHPLRERMSGRLMLALYRCGRRAEALAAYRRLHQALRDELGVEPSAEVAGLHAAILRRRVDGPAGNGPAAGRGRTDAPAAAGGSGCPGDREAQLAVLDGLAATRGAPVAVVTGMPGVRKTALVRHWTHRAATTWPTNMPAASSCTRSRRIRPRADRPPPSEYLIASALTRRHPRARHHAVGGQPDPKPSHSTSVVRLDDRQLAVHHPCQRLGRRFPRPDNPGAVADCGQLPLRAPLTVPIMAA